MMKKVLIVDDSDANLYLLKSLLEDEGLEVTAAKNGQEALERAHADPPDLIVSDILMPVMDGYLFCRRCKEDERLRQIPFVFYTATYTEPKDEQLALSLGADRFVLKPQEPEILAGILREVWEARARAEPEEAKPLGEEMEFFRQYNEVLFRKLEKKVEDLEAANRRLNRQEEALEHERNLLRNLIDNVPDRIYAKDSGGRFVVCNEAMVRRMGKTGMAEIVGKSDFDLLPREMAQRFHADEQAIFQTGIPMINREEPLATEGGTITRWSLATKVPLLDRQGNRIGIVGVGREITDLKQAEQKLQDSLERLRKAVNATIQVMVSAVEIRDPYTAGHQLRVADLACAIAGEMGLAQDRRDGIRMAGSIHDIGKLSVPAEILAKPTKLTAIEFSLIKEHSRQGYEMLKEVESPWLLAQIVHQHHERMDGSGYPGNLKGDEILVEARIMGVADVVESMASHRPYRPTMGIDAALEEISKNRGILYDPTAVDACLRLFREKRHLLV